MCREKEREMISYYIIIRYLIKKKKNFKFLFKLYYYLVEIVDELLSLIIYFT
jgi:hypothetical protein